jgi:NADPH-dependent 2,4-dienoyl-CoA reductase/sulfur reductase-like enzyme/ferredoxin
VTSTEAVFRNYTQLPQRLPQAAWMVLRILALGAAAGVAWLLLMRPEQGLQLFWRVIVPSLPLAFAVAPGLWRNVCPMAFANQLPRTLGASLDWTLPQFLRVWCYAISTGLFIALVALRGPLLDHRGDLVALMIAAALALALAGGLLFKGRSGWCGTFCPLAPIQKVHGQAPIAVVPNAYCPTCIGCQKNCYDFNPRAAIFGDLYDRDERHAGQRRFFVAMLPGLILAYYTLAGTMWDSRALYFFAFALIVLVSAGLFQLLVNFMKVSVYKVATGFGLAALLEFYFFAGEGMVRGIGSLAGLPLPGWTGYAVQALVVLAGAGVLARALGTEGAYSRALSSAHQLRVPESARLVERAAGDGKPEVTERSSGRVFTLAPAQSLLEGLEEAGIKIDYGCRMGLCGADPVGIAGGAENLEPAGPEETATLRRLGLEGRARLACACRVKGPVTIDLEVRKGMEVAPVLPSANEDLAVKAGVKRVVIIGNGVAGMAAAEALRRLSASCEIEVIAGESQHYYNRMSIGRVVYGRTAMDGLQLLPDDWFERNRVSVWRNTLASRIDAAARQVRLATGEALSYDRLILATGAEAAVPAPGFAPHNGCFVLRRADDAAAIRRWVQEQGARDAIVLGGGVLGVEAADALGRLGLRVTLLHRGSHLMNRQIDGPGGRLLADFLSARGIETRTRIAVDGIRLHGRRVAVAAGAGVSFTADLCVASIGIRPNAALAREAGLAVRHGIVVDAAMRTSDPHVFAAGDAAELPGAPSGLWPVGAAQGEVAAANALGEARTFAPHDPPVRLKCDGIDVFSFGDIGAVPGAEVEASFEGGTARRVVTLGGRIVGACSVGQPGSSKALAAKVQGK